MKPCLIIMAAGLGSRYGGMKQIDPVDGDRCAIIDYSIYDARRAGFEQIILVIKAEHEQDFNDTIVKRVGTNADIRFVYQDITNLPIGIAMPEGRVRPWGTAHAVLSAKDRVEGPFAVINADDFYGRQAFAQIYQFLTDGHATNAHAMVGFRLRNTLTDNGFVSRGCCRMDEEGLLTEIIERTHIEKRADGIAYTEDDGANWTELAPDTLVSMNIWGFGADMMDEIDNRFGPYLRANLVDNPLKLEYFLPYVPDCLIQEKVATVTVLPTEDKWYGVTHPEDMPTVRQAIADMKLEGRYPAHLWG